MPPEARDQRDLGGENCRSDAALLPLMSGTGPENAGFGQHVVVQSKDDMLIALIACQIIPMLRRARSAMSPGTAPHG